MLSVWKAGGATLMLTPSIPESRLRLILQQIDPKVMISSTKNLVFASKMIEAVFVIDDEPSLFLNRDNCTHNKSR